MNRDKGMEFASWYKREHPRVLASLVLVSGDIDQARDAVDEAFCRALTRWDRVSTFDSPAGWTYKVALNLHRRARRRATLERHLLPWMTRATEVPAPADEIWQIVEQLPPRQRAAVVLRHVAALHEQEIAEILGVTRGTVSRTLRAAHEHLGQVLDEDEGDYDEHGGKGGEHGGKGGEHGGKGGEHGAGADDNPKESYHVST